MRNFKNNFFSILGPPPRPKPVEEPKPEEKPAESDGEEIEEEEIEDEYNSDGELIEKPQVEKVKKEKTPPPKEATPPPKEATPPKEPTPAPEETKEKVEKKKRNWAGDLEGSSDAAAEVKAPQKPAKSKYEIEFLTSLENRTAAEGTSCKLFCQISGFNPQFEWQFNGEPLEFGSDVVNKSNETAAALFFPKLKLSQSGEYKVAVKNRECRVEASCKLNVLETIKPKEEGMPPQFPFGIKREYLIILITVTGKYM